MLVRFAACVSHASATCVLQVYRCNPAGNCEGGKTASCAARLGGPLCYTCADGEPINCNLALTLTLPALLLKKIPDCPLAALHLVALRLPHHAAK